MKTSREASLSPFSRLELDNRISYQNLSLLFLRDAFEVRVERLSLLTNANLTNIDWPFGLNDRSW